MILNSAGSVAPLRIIMMLYLMILNSSGSVAPVCCWNRDDTGPVSNDDLATPLDLTFWWDLNLAVIFDVKACFIIIDWMTIFGGITQILITMIRCTRIFIQPKMCRGWTESKIAKCSNWFFVFCGLLQDPDCCVYLEVHSHVKFCVFFDLCRPVLENANVTCEHNHWLPWNPFVTLDAKRRLYVWTRLLQGDITQISNTSKIPRIFGHIKLQLKTGEVTRGKTFYMIKQSNLKMTVNLRWLDKTRRPKILGRLFGARL